MLEDRLHLLFDDNGAINIVIIANKYGEMHLFVVHIVSEVVVIENLSEYRVKSGNDGGVQSEANYDNDGEEFEDEGTGGEESNGVEGDVDEFDGEEVM